MTSQPHTFALLPRDGLFLNDGRGSFARTVGRAASLPWPFPSTLRGALRTAWGRRLEQHRGRALSPADWPQETAAVALETFLALCRPQGVAFQAAHRRWPHPADALLLPAEAHVRFLEPRRPPCGEPTLGSAVPQGQEAIETAREALWAPQVDDAEKPERAPLFWTDDDFVAWLAGKGVAKPDLDARDARALPQRLQIHVGVKPSTQTAAEGILYSSVVLETLAKDHTEWALGVRAELPATAADWTDQTFVIGGDSRLARAEGLDAALFDAPQTLLDAFHETAPRGLRLVVVTPAEFTGGWLPDGLTPTAVAGETVFAGPLGGLGTRLPEDLVLRAAYVPRAVHVSGWDVERRCPKRTRRLVPAGAVYFFERKSGAPFDEHVARKLWLAALGAHPEDGQGRVVPGVWQPHPQTV